MGLVRIFNFKKVLQLGWQNRSEFLPCQNLQPATQITTAHSSHGGIPAHGYLMMVHTV